MSEHGGVNLSKVTLSKATPSVSLTKRGSAGGQLRVNLNWNARPAGSGGGGFFKRLTQGAAPGIDLDLGCLYELADGSKGVVQALGNAFASHPGPAGRPVVLLDGDDRSGSNQGGENLLVDLDQSQAIRRILVFAYIYEGSPSWADAAGVVTLYPSAGEPVVVPLDETDPSARTCAIAMLDNTSGELRVDRLVRYVQGSQQALDEAFGWGMTWSTGSK